MRRVVLDTNGLLSAAMKRDTAPRQTVLWVIENAARLTSADTEAELLQVMARPRIAKLLVPAFVEHVTELMAVASRPTVSPRRGCPPPLPHVQRMLGA